MFEREILTVIRINTSAETVWNLISDFNSYPKWNPLMLKVKGAPIEGDRLEILVHLFLSTDMKVKPEILSGG